jgi:hypothetical protein
MLKWPFMIKTKTKKKKFFASNAIVFALYLKNIVSTLTIKFWMCQNERLQNKITCKFSRMITKTLDMMIITNKSGHLISKLVTGMH